MNHLNEGRDGCDICDGHDGCDICNGHDGCDIKTENDLDQQFLLLLQVMSEILLKCFSNHICMVNKRNGSEMALPHLQMFARFIKNI